METQRKTSADFITTIRMTHRLRAEIDAVRGLWAERTGRRPPAHEIIVKAIEHFLAHERTSERRSL